MYKKYTNKRGVPKAYLRQILLSMRLTTIILIMSIMQVSASTFAQRITLSEKNATLSKIFDRISDQSGYNFIFTSDLLKGTNPVSINVKDTELDQVLDQIFENQPVSFSIEDKTVVIKAKEKGFFENLLARFQAIDVKGKIVDENGQSLAGATVRIKGTERVTRTGDNGIFTLSNVDEDAVLEISFLGYKVKELKATKDLGSIAMEVSSGKLEEVSVVSTGYQNISKERVTGSFVQLDNKDLNNRVSTNIIPRLEDIVPGLIFNKNARPTSKSDSEISIRGQSTLFANKKPLIVLNNFPYTGDIENINPNDVESITVLKDAGAASIWGARAGNGVIVITTKGSKFNQPLSIEMNANITISGKPDVFYVPRMSTESYIEIERILFGKGFYTSAESSVNHTALSPVVELLIAAREHTITPDQANSRIDLLKSIDVRNDFDKYLNRGMANQQYSLSLRGGHQNHNYTFSSGYDRNLMNLKNNSQSRLTFNTVHSLRILKNKLELNGGVYFASTQRRLNNNGGGSIPFNASGIYPYAQLADEFGAPLPTTGKYRLSFLRAAEAKGLMSWNYSPLNEINLANNLTTTQDLTINTNITYKVFSWLKILAFYQFNRTNNLTNNIFNEETYYTRDLINNYTQLGQDGMLLRPIPMGAIIDKSYGKFNAHNLRGQLEIDRFWNEKHQITGIIGAELRDEHTLDNSFRLYGYDTEHAVSTPVNYGTLYPQYYNSNGTNFIPSNEGENDLSNRYISYYSNLSYTYLGKYILSSSIRLDRSNIFGVKTNQKGVPLFSIGASWEISREKFYGLEFLPYLRARISYGYNGNVDNTLSAYTTANYDSGSLSLTRLPYAYIVNPPNPELRWERVKIVNTGLDFKFNGDRISGSIEYFRKEGIDLIGNTPFPASTGILLFKGNTASTIGQGIDLSMNSLNFKGPIKWQTNFMYSYIADKVKQYDVKASVANYLGGGAYGDYPLTGKPVTAIYSYSWAGLDPLTGDPLGYIDGTSSKDYTKIIQGATPENILFNGSSRPTHFGAIRNTLTWCHLSISANISYRMNYYYRKSSVKYVSILNGSGGHGDYELRWQKPGDEVHTHIPSLPVSINNNRDNFYTFSSELVRRGDNIRFQDIKFNYTITRNNSHKLPFSRLELYAYANNIGLLWKKEKGIEDPDYQTSKPIRTLSFGIKADL